MENERKGERAFEHFIPLFVKTSIPREMVPLKKCSCGQLCELAPVHGLTRPIPVILHTGMFKYLYNCTKCNKSLYKKDEDTDKDNNK